MIILYFQIMNNQQQRKKGIIKTSIASPNLNNNKNITFKPKASVRLFNNQSISKLTQFQQPVIHSASFGVRNSEINLLEQSQNDLLQEQKKIKEINNNEAFNLLEQVPKSDIKEQKINVQPCENEKLKAMKQRFERLQKLSFSKLPQLVQSQSQAQNKEILTTDTNKKDQSQRKELKSKRFSEVFHTNVEARLTLNQDEVRNIKKQISKMGDCPSNNKKKLEEQEKKKDNNNAMMINNNTKNTRVTMDPNSLLTFFSKGTTNQETQNEKQKKKNNGKIQIVQNTKQESKLDFNNTSHQIPAQQLKISKVPNRITLGISQLALLIKQKEEDQQMKNQAINYMKKNYKNKQIKNYKSRIDYDNQNLIIEQKKSPQFKQRNSKLIRNNREQPNNDLKQKRIIINQYLNRFVNLSNKKVTLSLEQKLKEIGELKQKIKRLEQKKEMLKNQLNDSSNKNHILSEELKKIKNNVNLLIPQLNFRRRYNKLFRTDIFKLHSQKISNNFSTDHQPIEFYAQINIQNQIFGRIKKKIGKSNIQIRLSHSILSESSKELINPKIITNILKASFNQNFNGNNKKMESYNILDCILFLRNKYQLLKILNMQVKYAFLMLTIKNIEIAENYEKISIIFTSIKSQQKNQIVIGLYGYNWVDNIKLYYPESQEKYNTILNSVPCNQNKLVKLVEKIFAAF